MEYVTRARLYTLGDRLQARRFQKAIFENIMTTWPTRAQTDNIIRGIPLHHISELLEIVLTELSNDGKEDPLIA